MSGRRNRRDKACEAEACPMCLRNSQELSMAQGAWIGVECGGR